MNGFVGIDCSRHSCSRRGLFVNGECLCDTQYTGPVCSVHKCSNHGFAGPDGTCICDSGFVGPKCDRVETDEAAISSIIAVRAGTTKQCTCTGVEHHPKYERGKAFPPGVVMKVRVPGTSLIPGLGWVPCPAGAILPDVNNKASPVQWLSPPDVSPAAVVKAKETAAAVAKAKLDLQAAAAALSSGASAKFIVTIKASNVDEDGFTASFAAIAGVSSARISLLKSKNAGSSQVVVEGLINYSEGKEAATDVLDRLQRNFDDGELMSIGKDAIVNFKAIPPAVAQADAAAASNREGGKRQNAALTISSLDKRARSLENSVNSYSRIQMPSLTARMDQLQMKQMKNSLFLSPGAQAFRLRQMIALKARLGQISNVLARMQGAGRYAFDLADDGYGFSLRPKEDDDAYGFKLRPKENDDDYSFTLKSRDVQGQHSGGAAGEGSGAIQRSRQNAGEKQSDSEAGVSISSSGQVVSRNRDSAERRVADGSTADVTDLDNLPSHLRMKAPGRPGYWQRSVTAKSPHLGGTVADKFGDEAISEDYRGIQWAKAGDKLDSARTLVYGELSVLHQATCAALKINGRLKQKGNTSIGFSLDEDLRIKDVRTLSLSSQQGVAFGVSAPPVQLKTLEIPIPLEGHVNSIPHGLKSLSSVVSVMSLVAIRSALGQNSTTVMGESNFGPVTVITAGTGGINLEGLKLQDRPVTSNPFGSSVSHTPHYHYWFDAKNINIMRTNPMMHLNKAIIKLTILFS